jgi:glycosyltransferase involved in cell wall biosynthesis
MGNAIKKISVITVTARHGGIDVNWSSLRRQTFKDFEWILCDTLYEERKEAVQHYTKSDRRVNHIRQGIKDMEAKTWLNHAENQAIKASSGELIVLLQDYIHIQPDALEKFWYQYQSNPKYFVTGVGHQYGKPGKEDISDPKGLITIFKKPFEGVPEQVVWQDPRLRKDLGSYYPCMPADWEVNFAMASRKMFYDVGGFPEDYDQIGHAFDNCSVAERAFLLGYEPYIDQSNESFSINSDAWSKSSAKNNDNFIAIATYHQQKMQDIREGRIPLKFPFLQ